jgi:hypothetical protein
MHRLSLPTCPDPAPSEKRAIHTYDDLLRGKTRLRGPADFAALHALATYNCWPLGPVIYPNSTRYWNLVAFHDLEWARRRRGRLMKHEQLALQVDKARHAYRATGNRYYPFSRWYRHFMELNHDHRAVERCLSIDPRERRKLLLEWRAKSRPALRKLLRLIDEYRRIRPAVPVRSSSRTVH